MRVCVRTRLRETNPEMSGTGGNAACWHPAHLSKRLMGIRGNSCLTLVWIAAEHVSSVLLLRKEEWSFQNLPAPFPSCHSALPITSLPLGPLVSITERWSMKLRCSWWQVLYGWTQISGVLYRDKRSRRRHRIDHRVVADDERIMETFGWSTVKSWERHGRAQQGSCFCHCSS